MMEKDIEQIIKFWETGKGQNVKDLYRDFFEKYDIDNKYRKYGCTNFFRYDSFYFRWQNSNDMLIKSKKFKWNGIFELKPIFDFSNPNVSSWPIDTQFRNWLINRNYYLLIRGFAVDKKGYLKKGELSALRAKKLEYKRKTEHYINQLDEIDKEIIAVLKPFYYEVEQQAKKNKDGEALGKLIEKLESFFQHGMRLNGNLESLKTEWLPMLKKMKYVPEVLFQSVVHGTVQLCEKKQPIIVKTKPCLTEWQRIQRVINRDIEGKPVKPTKEEQEKNKNEFRKEREATGKKYDYSTELVRKYAARIVNEGSGNLSDFLTPSNDASSKLYNPILDKYNALSLSSVRDWLRKNLDDGSLQEEIEKQGKY